MKENLLTKYIVLFCLFSPLVSFSQEVKDIEQSVVFLKDGSIIKCKIIEDDEYKVKLLTSQNDTIEYSYKYIQTISGSYVPESFDNAEGFNSVSPKYHKTDGWFVNSDIIPWYLKFGVAADFDMSLFGNIAIGKRITSNLNLGLQFSNFDDRQLGLAPYIKYFLTKNQYRSKWYTEGYLGWSYNSNERLDYDYAPYAGINLGIQLASRKATRFYFEIGALYIKEKKDEIIRDGNTTTVVSKVEYYSPLVITLLGLEF